jgi:hypothetical protein
MVRAALHGGQANISVLAQLLAGTFLEVFSFMHSTAPDGLHNVRLSQVGITVRDVRNGPNGREIPVKNKGAIASVTNNHAQQVVPKSGTVETTAQAMARMVRTIRTPREPTPAQQWCRSIQEGRR